ncbi:992_t:CDS:2, partial [Acaulospora colombiana]
MNSDKNRNTQETKQSEDSSILLIMAKIDDSDIEMKESGSSNQTSPEPNLVITLNKLATEHPNTYLEEQLKEIHGSIKAHKT